MKTDCATMDGEHGYALLLVTVLVGVGMLVMGGAMRWASNNAILTERNNQFFSAVAAAEAATEKVVANVSQDFRDHGESQVYYNLSSYQGMVPAGSESGYWSGFSFDDAQGHGGKIHMERLGPWAYTDLQSQYAGLRGMTSTYRVVSDATRSYGNQTVTAGVLQEVQVASIPVFQFAIFYSVDLEINPGANMTIAGRVHSNTDLYTSPNGVSLTFGGNVTSSGTIYPTKKPGDPSSRSQGTTSFQAEHDSGLTTLNLPIGTNNSPDAVHAVLEIPPAGEDPNSPLGKQRFYNRADMIMVVSNNTVIAKSGSVNGFATTIPWTQVNSFATTNLSFYDKREGKTIQTTEIDVGRLIQWSQTNTVLRPLLGADVSSIFVADVRNLGAMVEPGIRLVNGQALPPRGLTIATPDPLYIKGNYNAPVSALGTTNTSNTLPAAVLADAITILSGNWSDANSSKAISYRSAADTTVNAAFLAGIVPTQSGYYSGGVENFPRFLESWSSRTFTYNGSMVVMFYSKIATMPWGGSDVYAPPKRNWTFDLNFMDSTKLPPGTPQLLTTIRARWAILAPGKVN